MDSKDVQLITKLKAGDSSAFELVYKEYYYKLLHVGRSFPNSFLSPKDFVQETFIRLLNNKEKLNEEIPLDSQMKVICKNIILNHLKRESKKDTVEEFPSFALWQEDAFGDELVDEVQIKYDKMMHWVDELPKQQKKVFTLHKLERYNYKEIEEITGLSQKTIANHIYYAKEYLRKQLSREK